MTEKLVKPAIAVEPQSVEPVINPEQESLKQRIYVEVMAALAGRGIPASEAAAIALSYAAEGVNFYQ